MARPPAKRTEGKRTRVVVCLVRDKTRTRQHCSTNGGRKAKQKDVAAALGTTSVIINCTHSQKSDKQTCEAVVVLSLADVFINKFYYQQVTMSLQLS